MKEPDHQEFIRFMISNYDYQHDCWKLNHDLTLKLKEEEQRDAYLRSGNNLTQFHDNLNATSSHNFFNRTSTSGFRTSNNSPIAEPVLLNQDSNVFNLTSSILPAVEVTEDNYM